MKTYIFPASYLLLLALASYIGVGLFYQAATADLDLSLTSAPPSIAAAAAPRIAAVRPFADYNVITARDLFRTADSGMGRDVPKPVDLAALQQTKLDLKLWGTLVLDQGRGSYAVIEDKKAGGQDLYRVGDQIQTALVKMILRERVVLEVDGKDEILQIEQLDDTAGSARKPAAVAAAARPAPEPEPVARDVSLERQAVEEAMGDVAELMKQVRIRPFFLGGQPAGLSLAGVAPGSIFAQMGIRNGDVLQAVDGQPIQSVDDIVNLYQSLKSAEDIAIQVRRGGRIEDIRYKIQ
jgi:general secretion pathway protein C